MTLPHWDLPTKCTHQTTKTHTHKLIRVSGAYLLLGSLPHPVDVLHKATGQATHTYTITAKSVIALFILYVCTLCFLVCFWYIPALII